MRSIRIFLACSVVAYAQCHLEVADEASLGECETEALKVQLVQTKVQLQKSDGLHPPGPGLELLELGSTRADFLDAVERLDARVRALDQVLAKVH